MSPAPPNAMSSARQPGMSRWQKGAIAVAIALLVANLVLPDERRELSHSSFGTVPEGHRAVHELLRGLALGGDRSLNAPHELAPGGTIWWIEPEGVCDARIAVAGLVDILDAEAVRWRVRPWVEAGGTAVVLLEPLGAMPIECDAIAGFALPGRLTGPLFEDDLPEGETRAVAESGDTLADSPSDEQSMDEPEEESHWPDLSEAVTLAGPRLRAPREIPLSGLSMFKDAGDWNVAARLLREPDEEDRPYILEREFGAGQLIVVADASFARNERLDAFDAAPLVVDLAHAWGAPKLDERAHGFVPEASPIRYLARSPARPVFIGLGLLGLLFVWRGTAQPARSVPEYDAEAPTLESFVHSLATLYARTGDHTRVLERHRELCFGRLRRHYAMPAHTPEVVVVERVERERRIAPEVIERIRSPRSVGSASELRRRVNELDEWVGEVVG